MNYLASLFSVVIIGLVSFHSGHDVCLGYFPDNDMLIPVSQNLEGPQQGLTEEEYHDSIDR